MDFRFSNKEEKLRTEIRKFVSVELPPSWSSIFVEEESSDDDWKFTMSIAKKLAEKGWLVMSWPKKYGGQDASLWEQLVYNEEVGYWGIPGSKMGIGGVDWVGPSLILFGSEEQKRTYIPLIASGDPDGVWCTGYSEPNAGSDFANIQTRATRDGNEYVINGQKVWTSAAHRARWCWLAAKTEPNAPKKHQGISLFIVDMRSLGINVNPLLTYSRLHLFNEVFFDNVRVPASNLVGEENKGWYQLMQSLAFERQSLAPQYYGYAKRLFEGLIEYARETRQSEQPLIQNFYLSHKLADIAIDLEALKMFSYQTTYVMSQGAVPVYESSRNKAFADGLLERLILTGTEILGCHSQSSPPLRSSDIQSLLARWYLLLPGITILAGTDEIEKNIVGQIKLELPRSY